MITGHPIGDLPVVFFQDATIRRALEVINRGTLNIVAALDSQMRLVGVATDGDLRRALLNGASLNDDLDEFLNKKPLTVGPDVSRSLIRDQMLRLGVAQVPVVDRLGRLVHIHTLRSVLGQEPRINSVLVLAGGRGTRLYPTTLQTPKPMVRIADRPILERLVDHLVGCGFRDITFAVSYLADQIVEHFGDGQNFGCKINYLVDDEKGPRGTGGPFLDFVRTHPGIVDPILVVNGDIQTTAKLSDVLDDHVRSGADISIVAATFTHEVPFGVLECDALGRVSRIVEKPLCSHSVNSGIYILNPSIAASVFSTESIGMTELINAFLSRGFKACSIALSADWADLGTHRDLTRAQLEVLERVSREFDET